jgi:hypothetical protein
VIHTLARRVGEKWKWILKAMSVVEEETASRKPKQKLVRNSLR